VGRKESPSSSNTAAATLPQVPGNLVDGLDYFRNRNGDYVFLKDKFINTTPRFDGTYYWYRDEDGHVVASREPRLSFGRNTGGAGGEQIEAKKQQTKRQQSATAGSSGVDGESPTKHQRKMDEEGRDGGSGGAHAERRT
jgi:hypothetical protein